MCLWRAIAAPPSRLAATPDSCAAERAPRVHRLQSMPV
jgi:hypothetical protein